MAILRHTAEGHGIALRPASKTDQIAAVYSAEQWCLAHRTRAFDYPAVHGMPAVESLAAILSRASGRRHANGPTVTHLPEDDLWAELTRDLTESERRDVAERVVTDLSFGGSQVLSDWLMLQLGPANAAGVELDEA